VGETGINAGIAGAYGVPVVLVVGDDVVCQEARGMLGDIETVATKQAIDRYAARSLPIKKTQALIEGAAERAMGRIKETKPHTIPAPIEFELTTKLTSMAHMCDLFPTVERRSAKVVAVKGDTYMEAYKQLLGCLIIGGATARGWL
jgi:D-amino peptidase